MNFVEQNARDSVGNSDDHTEPNKSCRIAAAHDVSYCLEHQFSKELFYERQFVSSIIMIKKKKNGVNGLVKYSNKSV